MKAQRGQVTTPLAPSRVLEELRSGTEWFRQTISGAEGSAAHLSLRTRLGAGELVGFVILNRHKSVRLSPLHFLLRDSEADFRSFRDLHSIPPTLVEQLAADLAGARKVLLVVLGVIPPWRNDALSLWRRFRAWLLDDTTVADRKEQELATLRPALLEVSELARRIAERVREKGGNADGQVVEALYDSERQVTLWDLGKVVKPTARRR